MVEVGGKPILWHIMNIYTSSGYKEFVIALGIKAQNHQGLFFELSLLFTQFDSTTQNG